MLQQIHAHYDSSVLDGASDIDKAITRAKELGSTALAMTDHGTGQGLYRFYKKCKEAGIKPILGIEMYMGEAGSKNTHHIIIIAKNNVGFKNLCHLMTHGAMENFYSKPRITMEMLREHKEGIIVTTACLGGELAESYRTNQSDALKYIAKMYQIFGEDFYLEIQPNSLKEQQVYNSWINNLNVLVKPVIGCDMHYVLKEDFEFHDTMLAMQVTKQKNDTKRFRFTTNDFYMMSEEEVRERLSYLKPNFVDMAIQSTCEIADKCDVIIETNQNLLPKMEAVNDKLELAKLCNEGFKKRYDEGAFKGLDIKKVAERIKYELQVICDKGYASYFLIVKDYLDWSRNNGVPVGPGRGSIAGCEIAFILYVSELEPIKHGLLFERFLNPTRNSPPDCDSDFDYELRHLVVKYLKDKYGEHNVAHIIAEGTFAFKKAFRDVLRTYGVESKYITALGKDIPRNAESVKELSTLCPQLVDKINIINPQIYRDMCELEGLVSHNSKHAAGVVICPNPVYDYVPCTRDSEDNTMMMAQWDKKQVEELGLYKFDLLAIKLITIFRYTIENIKRTKDIDIKYEDLYKIDMEDKAIYDIYDSGDLLGIFQFEAPSAKDVVLKAKPKHFEDVMACESICRPGVKEADMYIDKKKMFNETGSYDVHPYWDKVEHILESTYGAIVYQEQTMLLFHEIGGYSLGEADKLRKAKSLEPERERFVKLAIAKGWTSEDANSLFDRFDLGYSFNKSHAGVYGINSNICAWFKANHRIEFMSAVLTLELTKAEPAIPEIIKECRKYGIEVLPPDINKSTNRFEPYGDTILMPLNVIKGVGDSCYAHLLDVRPFNSFEDFLFKIQKKYCKKQNTRALIKAGVFSSFEKNRCKLLDIFNDSIDDKIVLPYWCDEIQIAFETETLGMSLTKHPLDGIININLTDLPDGTVTINAMINEIRQIKDKKQNDMAFVKFENKECVFEGIVFSRTFTQFKHLLYERSKLRVSGKKEGNKVLINTLEVL